MNLRSFEVIYFFYIIFFAEFHSAIFDSPQFFGGDAFQDIGRPALGYRQLDSYDDYCANGGNFFGYCAHVAECNMRLPYMIDCIAGKCCTTGDMPLQDRPQPFPPPLGENRYAYFGNYENNRQYPFPRPNNDGQPNSPTPFLHDNRNGAFDRQFRERSSYAMCYNAQRSRSSCETQRQCHTNEICINGICCTSTGDELQNACGGTSAVSRCVSEADCQGGMYCTPAGYCCECAYGQAAGHCSKSCPSGFFCEVSGYCCPRCTDGRLPYGSCYNLKCADGFVCRPGNICCSV